MTTTASTSTSTSTAATGTRGRLSPVPPVTRTRSTSPSQGALPRASISSARSGSSARKTPVDFEAALRNPGTMFLSAGPDIEDDGEEASYTPEKGLRGGTRRGDGDGDAPDPVEKRSFEDDMREAGRSKAEGRVGVIPPTPRQGEGRNTEGMMSTPKKDRERASTGPAASVGSGGTGSARVVDRRTSQATMASQDSYGSPSRLSAISGSSSQRQMSVGLDAELGESQKMGKPKKITKRRSMFRSPGTASSPDLATLVRKAKEAKGAPPTGSTLSQGSNLNGHPSTATTTAPAQHSRHAPPPPHMTHSQSVGANQAGSSNGTRSTSNPANGLANAAARNGSRVAVAGPSKSTSGGSEDWDKFSDLKSFGSVSPEKMATISERPGGGTRSRESSHDGSKSLRNKAKGMLGRMFGGPSSREHTPTTSPATPSTARFGTPDQHLPPVPPVPASYRREDDPRRKITSPTLASARSLTSPQLAQSPRMSDLEQITPTMHNDGRFDTPLDTGRRSATPNGRKEADTSTNLDKPLPPIQPSPAGPSRSQSASQHGTLHRRQAAAHNDEPDIADTDDSPPQIDLVRPSPRRPATMSFSDDVAGIFDAIGQSEPAQELGLPPDSMRMRDRASSADVVLTGGKNRFPADLGRSMSIDTPSRRPDQAKLGIPPQPGVATRTSSLPSSGSPRPRDAAALPQRTTSSPSPSPSPRLTMQSEGGLFALTAPSTTISRSSSTSSKRQSRNPNGSFIALVPPPNLGSPLQVSGSDFGPNINGEGNGNADTLKPRKESADLPPLSPASVRLVTAPNAHAAKNGSASLDGLSRTGMITAGAWGRQSPAPRPSSQATDTMEIVHTPTTPRRHDREPEDDEEKGRRLACEFLDDDFSSVPVDKVAEYLGGPRRVNTAALKYYMTYFDMKGQTLVESFRDLCAKLHLKAESQEIDRIIEGFSARYYDCNPSTVFGTPGVVHTVTAAMLMLNTDLHIADLQKHMTRADFVRNAMRAIQESMPSDRGSTPDLVRDDSGSVRLGSSTSIAQNGGNAESKANGNPANGGSAHGASATMRTRPGPNATMAQRSASAPVVASALPPSRADSERSVSGMAGAALDRSRTNTGTPTGSAIYGKAWESEAESALKDIFNQVRADKILLPIGNMSSAPSSNRQSVASFNSATMRSPSGRSNDRINALKRGSIRGMQGLMNHPYNSVFSNSDGRLSPTPSYATSINDNSAPPTIGFASNLSHTVIKEQEDEKDSVASGISVDTSDEDLNDDELALLGAPWAKEGMLWKRTGSEVAMKKVGKKDWKQYFAVVQKGEFLLFTFGEGSGGGSFGAMGGGNWLNNANTAGRYSLTHTQAKTIKGGYSKDRPYVFCLLLPQGEAVYLAAGTDDLVTEWVNTCNYWSARRSRQPLQGGVGNIEYGWNRVLEAQKQHSQDGSASPEDDKASIRSSSSKMSRFNTATYGRRSFNATPGDRVYINDWRVPQCSLVVSSLEEEAQLEVLRAHHRAVGEEFEGHRVLEEPMMKLFTQGSKNALKAHANWTAKSRYLLSESHKYRIYVDTLREAIDLRVKKQGEKKLERSLARSMSSLHRRESADLNRDDPGEGEGGEGDDVEYGGGLGSERAMGYGEGRNGGSVNGVPGDTLNGMGKGTMGSKSGLGERRKVPSGLSIRPGTGGSVSSEGDGARTPIAGRGRY